MKPMTMSSIWKPKSWTGDLLVFHFQIRSRGVRAKIPKGSRAVTGGGGVVDEASRKRLVEGNEGAGLFVRGNVSSKHNPKDPRGKIHLANRRWPIANLLRVCSQLQLEQRVEGNVRLASIQEKGYSEPIPLIGLHGIRRRLANPLGNVPGAGSASAPERDPSK